MEQHAGLSLLGSSLVCLLLILRKILIAPDALSKVQRENDREGKKKEKALYLCSFSLCWTYQQFWMTFSSIITPSCCFVFLSHCPFEHPISTKQML